MPTRTPAEKERIRKREQRGRLIAIIGAVLIIAIVAVLGETQGFFRDCIYNDESAIPLRTEPIDCRLEYLKSIGITAHTVTDDVVLAEFPSDDGTGTRVEVRGIGGPVSVALTTQFPVYSYNVYSPDLFPNVDKIDESKVDYKAETASPIGIISRCLAPLGGDIGTEELNERLYDTLKPIYLLKADTAEMLLGVYRVSISFSASDGLMSISAEPLSESD